MTAIRRVLLAALAVWAAHAWAQPNQREAHLGYLYPAGGQRGATFQILAGGQHLRGVRDVYVSGEGVHASVIHYFRPLRKLDREQRQALIGRMRELWEKRCAELPRKDRPALPPGIAFAARAAAKPNATMAALPDHPLLYDLDNLGIRGLVNVANEIMNINKRQPNAQIAETVLIEVAVEPDAAPGARELRLGTAAGLTNPMSFHVGLLPEVREQEPNDPKTFDTLPQEPPSDLPILLNGQIMPGDVDRFRFRATRGQPLVIETQARCLVPYLADAVPGWFQPTLALYDSRGNEMAFADDYRFDPDPVLFYEIPEEGEYELEIRDSLYRGREDFVYRIALGEQPFITGMFPLGGQSGTATAATITGWNLSRAQLRLDTRPDGPCIRQTAVRQGSWRSNEVRYAVNALPECEETEPNGAVGDAQRITLPHIVNGRIAQAGDVDVFEFAARAGDTIVAEVYSRRLRSPLDSLLRLTDASGRVLEWNDDHEDREMGLCTHHADSYLCTRLTEDGNYFVHLADALHHGGEAYAYRLRITPPQPDFALRVTPSSLSVPAGRAVPLCVHALRKDGFDGEITLALKDAPAGFALAGARIPAGQDRVRMTLAAPRKPLDGPIPLLLQGRAEIDGHTVSRPALPAEDMMQAFIYWHLVPSQELMVAVRGARSRVPPIQLAHDGTVRIPVGGTTRIQIKIPKHPRLQEIQFELNDPPEGVTLQDVTVVPEGLVLELKADADTAKPGVADNLIVEAFIESADAKQDGKAAKQKPRVSLGVLPAIPFEIVPQ